MLTATAHTTYHVAADLAELAGRLPERPDAVELEAVIGAIDERLETATPDVIEVLRASRRRLELELASIVGA